jgi:hypothetical protein
LNSFPLPSNANAARSDRAATVGYRPPTTLSRVVFLSYTRWQDRLV